MDAIYSGPSSFSAAPCEKLFALVKSGKLEELESDEPIG